MPQVPKIRNGTELWEVVLWKGYRRLWAARTSGQFWGRAGGARENSQSNGLLTLQTKRSGRKPADRPLRSGSLQLPPEAFAGCVSMPFLFSSLQFPHTGVSWLLPWKTRLCVWVYYKSCWMNDATFLPEGSNAGWTGAKEFFGEGTVLKDLPPPDFQIFIRCLSYLSSQFFYFLCWVIHSRDRLVLGSWFKYLVSKQREAYADTCLSYLIIIKRHSVTLFDL